MFQFTNNWIINGAVDLTSGEPLWSASVATDTMPASFVVKRMGAFTDENVKAIYKAEYQAAEGGSVTITMKKGKLDYNGIGVGSYMIDLYARLSGQNENSLWANDFVLKGKPFTFAIEVTDDMTTADMAKAFADQINKMGIMYQDYTLTATANGNDLVIESGEPEMKEFVLFEKARLLQLDEKNPNPVQRTYQPIGVNGEIKAPVQGFGDYGWMIRNYRLPTTENRAIWNQNEFNQPIAGGRYNQYTIVMCNRVGVQGSDHVGDVVYAETTHVFYVLDTVATEFEAALATVGEIKDGRA